MTTQQLPYETRESTEPKGKQKAGSFEVLDRLEELPVVGTVYKKSSSAYDATKNYNGLTKMGFEVFEAPVKVVASHIDDNFGESLHRADGYVCAKMDQAGEAVRDRFPKLDKLGADIRRGPEGILELGERVVDHLLPPLEGQKSRFANPPKSNVRRAVVLGITIADRLISRAIYFLQALFAITFLTITTIPKKLKTKAESKFRTVQNLIRYVIALIFQMTAFLNPFYTYRTVKSYSEEVISKYTDKRVKKRAEEERERATRVAEEVVSGIDQLPKGEASKKRGKRARE